MNSSRQDSSRVLQPVLLAVVLLATAVSACAGTLGGRLVLEDEGSFFVNGQSFETTYPNVPNTGFNAPGHITVNQMYVHYWIPASANDLPPLVLVHGSNHSGMTYETTPDGREGWATYFVRQGFRVYVIDHSGRGRSGFNPTPINQAKAEGTSAPLPNIPLVPREGAWVNFRFGPEYPKPFPGLQFPVEALDQYLAQLVPNAETTLVNAGANTVNALAALLDKIGPAIVMVHSQSGTYGMDLLRRHSEKVKAFVDIEGNCAPVTAEEISSRFSKVPFLSLWGDYSVGANSANGDTRRNACQETVRAIEKAGGRATHLVLPEIGIKGNSHMLMMDKNNLEVANVVVDWLKEKTVTKR